MDLSDSLVPDADYSRFFESPALAASYPGLMIPPPSFVSSGAKILSFRSGESIALAFLVREYQLNPIGTLQGGILCAFFDDAFGCLAFASLSRPCVSISLAIDFIRAIARGEHVIVRAEFKSKGRNVIHLAAEARNAKGKLAATAMSSLQVVSG